MDARARTLPDNEIHAKIFHGGIKDFFHGWLEAMNFIEEEDFALFKRSEDGREVAFAFEKWAGAGFNGDVKLVGQNLCERGLAEAGRTIKEDVIESLFAIARGFKSDGDVFLDALLADVFGESLRADTRVEARVLIVRRAGNDSRVGHVG